MEADALGLVAVEAFWIFIGEIGNISIRIDGATVVDRFPEILAAVNGISQVLQQGNFCFHEGAPVAIPLVAQ